MKAAVLAELVETEVQSKISRAVLQEKLAAYNMMEIGVPVVFRERRSDKSDCTSGKGVMDQLRAEFAQRGQELPEASSIIRTQKAEQRSSNPVLGKLHEPCEPCPIQDPSIHKA